MKKSVLILIAGLAFAQVLQAQTFDEWFQQKKTQLSYLVKQIAALEAYGQVTVKGYEIVQQGTGLITGTKEADYDLHSGYFSSLLAVNPAIGKYPKADEINSLQSQIREIAGQARQVKEIMPEWAGTITAFFDGLLNEAEADIEELKMVITDGAVQMKDDERIAVIDRLYDRMKKLYVDAITARNDVIIMTSY